MYSNTFPVIAIVSYGGNRTKLHLDLSRLEHNALSLDIAAIDLPELIKVVAASFALSARDKNLHLRVDVASQVPRFVQTDSARLRQILVNLLGNAIKYTDHGEVALGVTLDDEPAGSSAAIRTTLARHAQAGYHRIRFAVSDTGVGIDPQRLPDVFEPFATVGPANRRSTGLGLAISQRLANEMGGQITVHSVPGEGSSFTLRLPMADSPEAPANAQADSHRVPHEAVSRVANPRIRTPTNWQESPRILLVDDDRFSRALMASLLAPDGFIIDEADDAERALELFERHRHTAVVTDFQMPGTSGAQLAARILDRCEQGMGTLLEPPLLVAMTGALLKIESASMDVFDRVVTKPVSAVQLTRTLNEALGRPVRETDEH